MFVENKTQKKRTIDEYYIGTRHFHETICIRKISDMDTVMFDFRTNKLEEVNTMSFSLYEN